jgi:group I intron endonuclease
MGIIYILTSPSNKNYIGQTIYTLENRWREHVYDAYDINKNHCRALNNAIKKYGQKNFSKSILLECEDSQLNYYEEKFINQYLSTSPAFGYNIKSGGSFGRHSDETKNLISNSLKGKIVALETKQKLSSNKNNKDLPMYIIECKKDNISTGYRVCNHPMGPEKRFQNLNKSLSEKYDDALSYLELLNSLDEPLKKVSNDLPKYIQKYMEGYCVSVPGHKTKYFIKKTIEKEERLKEALNYYNVLNF